MVTKDRNRLQIDMHLTRSLVALLLVVLTCACQVSNTDLLRASSSGHSGGSGGTSGFPGRNDSLATCPGSRSVADVLFTDSSAQPFKAQLSTSASVMSVDPCTADSCMGHAAGGIRVALMADGKTYTLLLSIPGMPAEIIHAGDTLDLKVAAKYSQGPFVSGLDQTVVLSRAGQRLVFASFVHALGGLAPPLPTLDSDGIAMTVAKALCDTSLGLNTCIARQFAAHVTIDGTSEVVMRGQTMQIGTTSFTASLFDAYIDRGNCDALSRTLVAGFSTL